MAVDLNNLESCSVAELVALVKQLLQRVERVEALEAENASLKEQLRASKRATAPFSKGKPYLAPKTPGRRAGEGRFERRAMAVPGPVDRVDDIHVTLDLPDCRCCGASLEVVEQAASVENTLSEPVRSIQRFREEFGRCHVCGWEGRVVTGLPELIMVQPMQAAATKNVFFQITMNIKQFFRRYAAARRLGLGFSGMARFTMPSAFTCGTEKILVHAPEERGLAVDFLELILDDDYGLKRIDTHPETIVDIGGNIGLFSLWANLNFPNAKIHCYEPNPRLQVYLSRNLRGKVTVYSEGVGSEDGRAAMLDNAESRLGRVGQGNELQITAIRTVLNRAGGKVDLLKMDCEGAEWDILKDTESIRKVREIRMEYHEVGGHVFADLEKLLEEQGFTRTYLKANNGFGIVHYKNNGPWDNQVNAPGLMPQSP